MFSKMREKLPEHLSESTAYAISVATFIGFLVMLGWFFSKGNVAFICFQIAVLYLGRKMGWVLSKNLLYTGPVLAALIACTIWGFSVALIVHNFINWQQPNIVVKIIMGYLAGVYLSNPAFGLLNEISIPATALSRHNLVSRLPVWTFIASMIVFAIFSHH